MAFGLDLAAWSVLRHVPFLAANPASASALALCWVQVFMLPSLLNHPWHGPRRLALAAGAGLPAAMFSFVVGIAAGLFVGFAAFDIMVAIGGRYDTKPPTIHPAPPWRPYKTCCRTSSCGAVPQPAPRPRRRLPSAWRPRCPACGGRA
ncbi:MAG: hypothetical protein ACRYHQ_03975 [Janthinobacterium lividum]